MPGKGGVIEAARFICKMPLQMRQRKISADAELGSCNCDASAHEEIQDTSQEQQNKPVPRIETNTHFISKDFPVLI